MLKDKVTIDETIEFLNELVEIDNDAIFSLVEARVSCNTKLAEHPTVQVQAKKTALKNINVDYDLQHAYEVGLLGILNGIFGTDDRGWGPITAEFDDLSGKLLKFRRTSVTPVRTSDK